MVFWDSQTLEGYNITILWVIRCLVFKSLNTIAKSRVITFGLLLMHQWGKCVITFGPFLMHHFTSKNPSAIFPDKFNIVQKANFSQMEIKKQDALRHQTNPWRSSENIWHKAPKTTNYGVLYLKLAVTWKKSFTLSLVPFPLKPLWLIHHTAPWLHLKLLGSLSQNLSCGQRAGRL